MKARANKELIRKFIMEKIAKNKKHMNISDNENILASGLLDSLSIINLIRYLEETFPINVNDQDIIPDNFESIEAISSYLDKNIK